ncbi:MAG: hypothetical protein IV107_24005 [Paucibacter sp.]|nr:hypothetical protein [Roseateles sp.]
MNTNITPDAQLIEDLGGAAKVAALLGFDKTKGGVQRVHNWIDRGIPAAVKVAYPEIFMRRAVVAAPAPAPTEQGA